MRSIHVKTSKIFRLAAFIVTMLTVSQVWANVDFGRSMHFKKMDGNAGLSHNQIHSITQDSKGFIWVGTMSGLNRLDGSNVKVFKYSASQPHSLPDNNITLIAEDSMGTIWIASNNGLATYNILKREFILKRKEKFYGILQIN